MRYWEIVKEIFFLFFYFISKGRVLSVLKIQWEKSKQNITRDIEIKNIVTRAGGDSGERGL